MNGITPNKAMKKRHDLMREIGCILCLREGQRTPPEIHHISGCKTQDDHANTLALCYWHHMADQQNPPEVRYTSRHPNKAAFERRYGTEQELLEYQNRLIDGRV